MQKILLYYKFTPIKDPETVKLWQKTLTDSLNLRGRILISEQGINGTVGGEMDDLKKYMETMEFASVQAFRGAMSQIHISDPSAYERSNYIQILEDKKWRK